MPIFNCYELKAGTVAPKITSVTDDVIVCLLLNKIIGCATASECVLISAIFPRMQIFFLAFALTG